MADARGPAFADLAESLADELGETTRSTEADVTTYARDGSDFARVTGPTLDVRLPADIAEAALRTSDTSSIPGQPGWVRFAPATDEPHVVDRAQAWFRTAWRHAVGGGR